MTAAAALNKILLVADERPRPDTPRLRRYRLARLDLNASAAHARAQDRLAHLKRAYD